jgi:hypothetical protein
MTSQRKVEANRANALRSTGARTLQGKARVRQNALRHGLATSVLKNSTISAEVERLAKIIAGEDPKPAKFEQAMVIAETELTLLKIRAVRAELINGNSLRLAGQTLSAEALREQAVFVAAMPALLKLDRYERRALSRREQAMRDCSGL